MNVENSKKMKAIVYKERGPPAVFQQIEVEKPTPKDDEVLVKVHAASINSWDWELLRKKPPMVSLGRRSDSRFKILGADIAGQVEAVGKGIKQLQLTDEVFGDLCNSGWGGFAEYVCARENALLRKPASMTFEQAAAIPQAGLLALQGLRKGQIQQGQKVLLNGAGGGVGSFALQIAKSLGAEVTGVDSKSKLDMLRSIGADEVIDYTKEDFTKNGQTYDLILDVVATRSLSDYKHSLLPDGKCVLIGGSKFIIFKALCFGSLGNKKVSLLLYKPNKELAFMTELFEAGKVIPVIDRCYPLSKVAEAFRYFGEGNVKGKIVINVVSNNKT
jgi:NADPH:quinone reductase-like Zn-dependent oxidoreductase